MSRIIARKSCHQSNHLKIYWQETSLVLTANVHELSSEEVRVDIRDRRVFLIIGEGRHECHETASFEMPQNVNLNQIKTMIENGVLSVTVPIVKNKKKNPAVVSHSCGCRGGFFC